MLTGLPGMGIMSEAYILFAIGNIKPLLAIDYPNCFGDEQPPDCNQTTVEEVETVEICGIISGMLVIGAMADTIGRRKGSILTASIMCVGAILLTGAWGSTSQQFLSVFCFALFLFATGVGGEYPIAASSAAEKAEASDEYRKKRGELVILTFSQQGWGNVANVIVILLLMVITGSTEDPISADNADTIWRTQFGIGAALIIAVSIYRWTCLEESEVWKQSKERSNELQRITSQAEGRDLSNEWGRREYLMVLKYYWPRLFATTMCWLLINIVFYGNKLFQSSFIAIITPGASQFVRMEWTLLNSTVALIGYYCAAYTVDRSWWGRFRLQSCGFLVSSLLFLICAVFYDQLIADAIAVFQTIYFLTSFFAQFGANCTTFLVAGEVYPTEVRSCFHGISAACGKIGALIAAQTFVEITTKEIFWICCGSGILGFIVTFFFLPDTTGLDLSEIDRKFNYYMGGIYEEYHGEAINPKHLSYYERWRGYGKAYDPEEDNIQEQIQSLMHHRNTMTKMATVAEEEEDASFKK